MFDIDSIKEIKIIKQSERQNVLLMEDSNGKQYLKRVINGDKREIYKSLKKINHEIIPKIYYVGFDSDTIVIEEYIEGISLSDYMAQNKKLSKKQVCFIANQLLSALDELHKSDIIHKDIKPDNILIDDATHIWLTDYDIARIYRKEVRRDTEAMGTFGYAPIEQFGILPTDFKTDIYAFGVTLNTLLDYINVKGFLYKVAEKCKRLDPSQRYKSAKKVKRAITLHSLILPFIALFFVAIIIILLWNACSFKTSPDITEDKPDNQTVEQPIITPTTIPTSTENPVKEIPSKEPVKTPESFEGTFADFPIGTDEARYQNLSYYSNVCIFGMQSPWEHLIFIDDMNKTGKLKLGENDTVVDADITLTNGNLSVKLNDRNGNTFNHQFQFNDQYEYEKNYTGDLRKNADIICYDFNGDGATELLIGLNEGSMGAFGRQFYNNFNYCIAWCVQYDENKGFQLCDGDMFSKGYAFWVNEEIRKLNIFWEDIGDVTGYLMEDDKIIPN